MTVAVHDALEAIKNVREITESTAAVMQQSTAVIIIVHISRNLYKY